MPHCPACGLWVHPADPQCMACDADLSDIDDSDGESYEQHEGLMADEVTRGRLHTELTAVEFGFSFAYGRGPRPVIIGAGLLALSWLILPFFAMLGYVLRTGNEAAKGRDKMPELEDLTNFLGDGLRLFLSTVFTYWLPIILYLYLANFYLVEADYYVHIFDVTVPIELSPVPIIAIYTVAFFAILLWPPILAMYTGAVNIAMPYNPKQYVKFLTSAFYLKSLAAVFVHAIWAGITIALLGTGIAMIDFFVGIEMAGLGIVGGILAVPLVAAILLTLSYALLAMFSTLGYVYYYATQSVVVPPVQE